MPPLKRHRNEGSPPHGAAYTAQFAASSRAQSNSPCPLLLRTLRPPGVVP